MATEKTRVISKDRGRSKRLCLLRMGPKVLLCDRKDIINHCCVLFTFFFDIFLGVTLLKVDKFVRCCDGITFGELEIELAHFNRSLQVKSLGLNVHFARGPANSTDHYLACATSQTKQHDSLTPLGICRLAGRSECQEPGFAC